MLELICKELGVEIGEEWKNNVGDTYKIDRNGLFYEYSLGDWDEVGNLDYKRLLMGELKPIWIPKKRDWYYFPEVAYTIKYGVGMWSDDKRDKERLERGIVFKTKDEAIECANKMIEAIK